MKILVQKLEGNKVLDLIGVVGIRLIPPNKPASPYFLTVEQVREICDTGKKTGVFDDEQIAAVLEDCETLGMKPNIQAILDAVKAAEIPDELAGDYEFVMCECEMPLPHGYIRRQDDEFIERFSTWEHGFEALCDLDRDDVTPEEVVHLLKKMAVLPINKEAQKPLYEALTPEQKDALRDQRKFMNVVSAFLNNDVEIVTFRRL